MQKRGQITLFLIIAVVMLVSIGAGLYFLLDYNRPDVEKPSLVKSAALEAASSTMRSFVQSCLEKKTREAIDNYGIRKDYSEELIKNYIDSSMIECVDFAYFESKGFIVEEDGVGSEARIEEDAILVMLDFPLRISNKAGTNAIDLNGFEYNIQRAKGMGVDATGIVPAETRIVSEDGDAELVIHAKTHAYMLDGSPVGEVSIRMEDKNVDGLSNKAVIGTTVYSGGPDGAWFDPAITARFTIDYADVPTTIRYTNLKCAYYDDGADIWRTYETISVKDNGPGESTYTVSCLVPHFSLIAVVQCGMTETEYNAITQDFVYDPLFMNPLLPTDDLTYWFKNAEIKGGDGTNKGIHLIPEKTDPSTGCNPKNGQADNFFHIYSGTGSGIPGPRQVFDAETQSEEYCNSYLLQDWDNDDDPANSNAGHFTIHFVTGGWGALNPSNAAELAPQCYSDCAAKASGIAGGASPLPSSGEGINDYLEDLYCTATEIQDCSTGTCIGTGRYENPRCMFEDGLSSSHPFNNVAVPYVAGSLTTMEYPINPEDGKRRFCFVATPKTYGYSVAKSEDITDITYDSLAGTLNKIKLGGIGELELEMGGQGDSCVFEQFTPIYPSTNPVVGVFVQNISGGDSGALSKAQEPLPVIFHSTDKDMLESCSDLCIWTINDANAPDPNPDTYGKLRGGMNYVRVYVGNLALTEPDPIFWAKAKLRFIGIGFTQAEESYGQTCWCVRQSETQFTGCGLYPTMPSDGQLWVKKEDMCTGRGGGGGGGSGNYTFDTDMPTYCSAEQRPTYYKCEVPLGCILGEEIVGDLGCQDDVYDCHYCNDIDPSKVCCAMMMRAGSCNSTLGCVPDAICVEAGGKEIESANADCNAFESGRVCCEASNIIEECPTAPGCVDETKCTAPNQVIEAGIAGCKVKIGYDKVCCGKGNETGGNKTAECQKEPGCVDAAQCAPPNTIFGAGNESCKTAFGESSVCCEKPALSAPCTTSLGCTVIWECTTDLNREVDEAATPSCQATDKYKVCCKETQS